MDYAEQTALIAMRAKRALVSRQIDELNKAKKAITMDFESADAQLMLAQVRGHGGLVSYTFQNVLFHVNQLRKQYVLRPGSLVSILIVPMTRNVGIVS